MPKILWENLSKAQRTVYTYLLLTDGYTREAIGLYFVTSKNSIVGLQHRSLPWLTNQPHKQKPAVAPDDGQRILAGIDVASIARELEQKKRDFNVSVARPVSTMSIAPRTESTITPKKVRAKKKRGPKVRSAPKRDVDLQPEDTELHVDPIETDTEKQFKRELIAEVARQEKIKDTPAVSPEVKSPASDAPQIPVSPTTGCRYPLSERGRLNEIRYCGKETVYMRCCDTHASQLYASYRRFRKRLA